MQDLDPQTAAGKVLIHFVMSLDGFVSRADGRDMDWMTRVSFRPGLAEQAIESTGAILADRHRCHRGSRGTGRRRSRARRHARPRRKRVLRRLTCHIRYPAQTQDRCISIIDL